MSWRADHVPILIFDEIDQGIGGRCSVLSGVNYGPLPASTRSCVLLTFHSWPLMESSIIVSLNKSSTADTHDRPSLSRRSPSAGTSPNVGRGERRNKAVRGRTAPECGRADPCSSAIKFVKCQAFSPLIVCGRVYNPSILSPSTRCSLPECRWQGAHQGPCTT
jgi:hypothetical protein